MSASPALARAAWAGVAAAAGAVLSTFYVQPIGWGAGSMLAALVLLSAVRPQVALLALAALAPLSTVLFSILQVRAGGLRIVEALTLAFLAGWAARHAIRREAVRIPSALAWTVSALIAITLLSAVVSATAVLAEGGPERRAFLADDMYRGYSVDTTPLSIALQFAGGLLLLLGVADTCAANPGARRALPRMMVIGAAAAAAMNLLHMAEGALRREAPLRAFVALVTELRFNFSHGDLNAASSYFALMLFVAAGMAFRWRTAGIVSAVLIAAGLWMAGSRTAFVAVAVTATVAALVWWPIRRKWKVAAAVIVLLLVAAFGRAMVAQFPMTRYVSDPSLAFGIRAKLAKAAVAMTADHPVFGVGAGHFFTSSDKYADEAFYAGERGNVVRENAHNNFLQVMAELGIPALVLFGTLLILALRAGATDPDPLARGLLAGVGAFLLTALGGHPLLVPHVAYPFWMAVGVLAVPIAPLPRDHAWIRRAAIAMMVFLALALPVRLVQAVRHADLEGTTTGFSMWQREEDGLRYRWAGGKSSFHVPTSAYSVRIPLRYDGTSPGAIEIVVSLDGQEANRILLENGQGWRFIRLSHTPRNDGRFFRVDLEARVPGAPAALDVTAGKASGLFRVGAPTVDRR